MAAAYDAAGNVNPAFATDINNWVLAMAQAAYLPANNGAIQAASTQINSDGVTGIASSATTP